MSSNTNDPYPSFRFSVEIDGINEAGFSEVSSINIQTEVEEQKEGGVNSFVYKLPKQTKYDDIKLKRGMTNSTALYDWYMDVVKGKIRLEEIAIVLYDIKGEEVKRWTFQKAFPIKWTGSDLNATNGNIFFESIEFAHNGF